MLVNVKVPTVVCVLTFNEHDEYQAQLSWT